MNIQDYYKYSWFSTLAYVDWRRLSDLTSTEEIEDANNASRVPGSTADAVINTLGEKIFSPATKGGEGWKVISFQPNDAAGFSASLFVKGDTNEKVLAIRGTEPGSQPYEDLLKTDLHEIGEYGMAISQAVSLFNYIQRLRAAAGSFVVPQLTLNISPIPPVSGNYVTTSLIPPKFISVNLAFNGTGLGLIAPEDNLIVTGHSLGGHLAAIAARLFPGLIDGAVTFNAPGFDPTLGVGGWGSGLVTLGKKLTEAFVNQLFAPNLPLYEQPISSFAALGNRVQSMISADSEPGFNNSGVSSFITGTAASPRQPITTERNSHMVEPIMDALAVHALIERLNPSIGMAGARTLFLAASDNAGKSEEKLLDALAKLFLNDNTPLPIKDIADGVDAWINPGDFGKRSALHVRAMLIDNKLKELSAGGASLNLVSLVGQSADTLITAAKNPDAIATRYALKELNPFAVLGADFSSFNTDGRLDLYNKATGTGNLTDEYLTDRAAFLTWTLKANTADKTTLDGALYGYTDFHNWQFKDLATDYTLHLKGTALGLYSVAPENQVIFGKDGADIYTGGDEADYLYGGLGYDVIDGAKGNDYLEGNAGDDELKGGDGSDTLVGGADDDHLTGGTGSDTLNGGLGTDTYRFIAGDGWDWVEDTDGLGQITYDDVPLTGGAYIAPNVWQQKDTLTGKTYTYSLYDRTEAGQTFQVLAIQGGAGPGGGLWIKRWQPGQLGLTLPGAPEPIVLPPTTATPQTVTTPWYTPNHTRIDAIGLGTSQTTALGDHGEVWGNGQLIGNDFDNYLKDGAGNHADDLTGNGGRDTLIASGGNDRLYGGAADDALQAGADNDYLEGNSGNDVLAGDGADLLFGGMGDDHLWGDWRMLRKLRGGTKVPYHYER